jgi:3-hydroxybutyryl-CoA dehydrogenase
MSNEPRLRIGVVGAGVMGSGIAQVLAVAGHAVRCTDIEQTVLDRATEAVRTGRFGVEGSVARGKLTAEEAEAALARLTFTTDRDAALDADLVIEAIPERLELKLRFWAEVDRVAPQRAIFASNSSGFPIAALAAVTSRPDRMIGWHWASPAPVMRLAEIVRGPETSDATVDTVVRLAAGAGKNPIVVADTTRAWGYVANRVYAAMAREARQVVEEGIATREQVDQLMMDCFRWPSGPFGMATGATTGWKK